MAADTQTSQWRLMEVGDLTSINAMANIIHPDFFEDAAVLSERLKLYPQGCFVLSGANASLIGYAITHPWHLYAMPALNSLLGGLPEAPSTYYLHDIALLPQSRGTGAAGTIVSLLADHASRSGFSTMSLVAVNGSTGFWEKQGFRKEDHPELNSKLQTYSNDARFMVRHLR
jgi:GNAT superfamily N-acetyltransferase